MLLTYFYESCYYHNKIGLLVNQIQNSINIGDKMMKKKSLLTGIASLALVFTLILAGCPTDGGDGGGGGGGGNPLLGTWANDQDFANLNHILIFTDSPVTGPGIAENTKQAYHARNLQGNSDYITEGAEYKIPITGAANSPYTADISTLHQASSAWQVMSPSQRITQPER
jgi:hypothetical protein